MISYSLMTVQVIGPSFNTPASTLARLTIQMVWALSVSLATTQDITFVLSSSAYLDVSVQRVCSIYLCIQ